MASTDSGSAWSIADARDDQARDDAYRRSPARFVMVTMPGGSVPGIAYQWRETGGRREGLTCYPVPLEDGDWGTVTAWVGVERFLPVEV